jgi:hypothetical protein
VNEAELRQKFSVELSRYSHVFNPQIDVIKATRFHFVILTRIASQFNCSSTIVARANEKLTAFIKLESAIWQRVKYWEIIADNLSKAG